MIYSRALASRECVQIYSRALRRGARASSSRVSATDLLGAALFPREGGVFFDHLVVRGLVGLGEYYRVYQRRPTHRGFQSSPDIIRHATYAAPVSGPTFGCTSLTRAKSEAVAGEV